MIGLRFEWEETKNRSNQKRHDGISFEVASQVFRDPLHISVQDRLENGEQRWQTIGMIGSVVILLVAHTFHEETDEKGYAEVIRIISARRATRKERIWYENEKN